MKSDTMGKVWLIKQFFTFTPLFFLGGGVIEPLDHHETREFSDRFTSPCSSPVVWTWPNSRVASNLQCFHSDCTEASRNDLFSTLSTTVTYCLRVSVAHDVLRVEGQGHPHPCLDLKFLCKIRTILYKHLWILHKKWTRDLFRDLNIFYVKSFT